MDFWTTVFKYADNLSVVVILILVIVGGFKRWWVWGYQHAEKSRECEEWKAVALRQLMNSERLGRVTERAVDATEQALQSTLPSPVRNDPPQQ